MDKSDETNSGPGRAEPDAGCDVGAIPTGAFESVVTRVTIGPEAPRNHRPIPHDRRDAGRFATSRRKGAAK